MGTLKTAAIQLNDTGCGPTTYLRGTSWAGVVLEAMHLNSDYTGREQVICSSEKKLRLKVKYRCSTNSEYLQLAAIVFCSVGPLNCLLIKYELIIELWREVTDISHNLSANKFEFDDCLQGIP